MDPKSYSTKLNIALVQVFKAYGDASAFIPFQTDEGAGLSL